MAMGKRGRQRQENLFIASNTLVKSPGHPFYEKLNQVLGANGFDEFVEGLCQRYYAPSRVSREPELTPRGCGCWIRRR